MARKSNARNERGKSVSTARPRLVARKQTRCGEGRKELARPTAPGRRVVADSDAFQRRIRDGPGVVCACTGGHTRNKRSGISARRELSAQDAARRWVLVRADSRYWISALF